MDLFAHPKEISRSVDCYSGVTAYVCEIRASEARNRECFSGMEYPVAQDGRSEQE